MAAFGDSDSQGLDLLFSMGTLIYLNQHPEPGFLVSTVGLVAQ
jgi:hypothetical protein